MHILAVVPLSKFAMEFQHCLTIFSGTGDLEVGSRCKRHCLLLTWQVYIQWSYNIALPFPVEPDTLRLPVRLLSVPLFVTMVMQ